MIKPLLSIVLLTNLLSACSIISPPPKETADACAIFEEKSGWYYATQKAEDNWHIPAPLILAFVNQESAFVANAKPPRTKLWGFIPWSRPSSAYGYPQATKPAWKDYERETKRKFAFRNRYSDAADFIAWYNDRSVKQLKLARTDAYKLYLAYHEGLGGYRNKSYEKKKWLLEVAKRVENNYKEYTKQLKACSGDLKTRWYEKIFVGEATQTTVSLEN